MQSNLQNLIKFSSGKPSSKISPLRTDSNLKKVSTVPESQEKSSSKKKIETRNRNSRFSPQRRERSRTPQKLNTPSRVKLPKRIPKSSQKTPSSTKKNKKNEQDLSSKKLVPCIPNDQLSPTLSNVKNLDIDLPIGSIAQSEYQGSPDTQRHEQEDKIDEVNEEVSGFEEYQDESSSEYCPPEEEEGEDNNLADGYEQPTEQKEMSMPCLMPPPPPQNLPSQPPLAPKPSVEPPKKIIQPQIEQEAEPQYQSGQVEDINKLQLQPKRKSNRGIPIASIPAQKTMTRQKSLPKLKNTAQDQPESSPKAEIIVEESPNQQDKPPIVQTDPLLDSDDESPLGGYVTAKDTVEKKVGDMIVTYFINEDSPKDGAG